MDPSRLNSALGAGAPGAIDPLAPAAPPLRPEEAAPGFQALLEKLEATAGSLAQRELQSPDQVAGALEDARASLETALDLGRDLIEAFRQERLQAGGDAA